MERFGALFDSGMAVNNGGSVEASPERRDRAQSAYLFSYVDSPRGCPLLKRDLLPAGDDNVKIPSAAPRDSLGKAAQFAATFLAYRSCPAKLSRPLVTAHSLCLRGKDEPRFEGALPFGQVCDDEELLILQKQHQIIADEAEKTLARCLAKFEVECLNEFLTRHDRPLDDAEMIR
ncbi:hypothetical protein MRX96_023803 [Rhipicephalus microplus]